MPSSTNVVAVCTQHIAQLTAAKFKAQYGAAATPAQVAAVCGYPGKAASAWRHHLARQHGAGAVRNGHGRYPALTYPQWCKLLGVVQRASSTQAKPSTQQAARKQVTVLLWGKQVAAGAAGAKQAKQQAQQASTQASTPQAN